MTQSPRPLWLVVDGAPRSGTTCLQQMLNTHPHIVCTHEVGPFRMAQAVHGLICDGGHRTTGAQGLVSPPEQAASAEPESAAEPPLETPAQASAAADDAHESQDAFVARHEFYWSRHERVLSALADPLPMPRPEDFDTLVRTLAGTIARKTDVRIIGDKLPNAHLLGEDPIVERYGLQVKTLFVVRNPLNVINSSMGRRNDAKKGIDVWHIDTVEEAAAEWLTAWNYAVRRREDPDFMVVKYEDLVSNFRTQAAAIADFLGVDPQFENIVAPLSEPHSLYALTSPEREYVDRLFGDFATRWSEAPLPSLLGSDLQIFAPLTDGRASFGESVAGGLVLQQGFSPPEPNGWWTAGRRSVVRFYAPPSDKLWVDLKIYPFLGERPALDFVLRASGGACVHHRVVAGEALPTRRGLLVSAPDGRVEIELLIPEPKQPHEPPQSDPRALGLHLSELRVSAL